MRPTYPHDPASDHFPACDGCGKHPDDCDCFDWCVKCGDGFPKGTGRFVIHDGQAYDYPPDVRWSGIVCPTCAGVNSCQSEDRAIDILEEE